MYTGIIPAPVATTRAVEYVILVEDNNGNIQTSPSYVMLISNELGCSKYLNSGQSERIVVYAESPAPPEFGFSGKNVQWNVSNYSGKTYLNNPINTQAQASSTSSAREQGRSVPLLDKKTALGLGVGLGAAAATVLLLCLSFDFLL